IVPQKTNRPGTCVGIRVKTCGKSARCHAAMYGGGKPCELKCQIYFGRSLTFLVARRDTSIALVAGRGRQLDPDGDVGARCMVEAPPKGDDVRFSGLHVFVSCEE